MDVKLLCLGALSHGAASGYEIRKALMEGPMRYFSDVGFGSIYPALGKLRAEGLVESKAEVQDRRPDKKVYSLTPAGRLELVDRLALASKPDRFRSDFLFKLIHAHLAPVRVVEGLIAARIQDLRGLIAELERRDRDATDPPGHRFVRDYGLAVYRASLDYLENHGHELVGQVMIDGERAAAPETQASRPYALAGE